MKRVFLLTALMLLLPSSLFCGSGVLNIYMYSRYARPAALGNCYTGIATGPETMFYNPAGLTSVNGFSAAFNRGSGAQKLLIDLLEYDLAITFNPASSNFAFGYMYSNMSFEFSPSSEKFTEKQSFHIAYKFSHTLSFAVSVNYYKDYLYSKGQNMALQEVETEISKSTGDFGLSVLVNIPSDNLITLEDEAKAGMFFDNILGSDIYDWAIYKQLRIGASYKFVPQFAKVADLKPLQILVASDISFDYSMNKAQYWQPNIGMELTLLEIFSARIGRENQHKINEDNLSSAPQFPVTRYGFGVNVPVSQLVTTCYKIDLRFDFTSSEWDNNFKSIGYSYRHYNDIATLALNIGF